MKTLARNISINGFSLFATAHFIAGLTINGGIITLIQAGLAFSLLSFLLKPILTLLTLPLNLVTFGAFSLLTNGLLLYLLTVLIPQIRVSAFTFPGVTFVGFVIPSLAFNTFFAYIVAAVVLSGIISFIQWLID